MAREGWVASHGEREFGASAVAVPLRGGRGQVVAALTVSGPTSRFTDERIRAYAAAAMGAAEQIAQVGLSTVEANLWVDPR